MNSISFSSSKSDNIGASGPSPNLQSTERAASALSLFWAIQDNNIVSPFASVASWAAEDGGKPDSSRIALELSIGSGGSLSTSDLEMIVGRVFSKDDDTMMFVHPERPSSNIFSRAFWASTVIVPDDFRMLTLYLAE